MKYISNDDFKDEINLRNIVKNEDYEEIPK